MTPSCPQPPNPQADPPDCTVNTANIFGVVNGSLPVQLYLQLSSTLVNEADYFHYQYSVSNYFSPVDARLIQPTDPNCFWQVQTIRGIAPVISTTVGLNFYDADNPARFVNGTITLTKEGTNGGWTPSKYSSKSTGGNLRACSLCNFSTSKAVSGGYYAAFVAVYVYNIEKDTPPPGCPSS